MRYDPVFLAYTVTSPTREDSRKIQEKLRKQIGPDSVMVDTRISAEGTEKIHHRIGDYFEEILLFSELEENPQQFRLVFHRHPRAGRFWKDIMVRLVRALETGDPKVAISMDYQGDASMDWQRLTPA